MIFDKIFKRKNKPTTDEEPDTPAPDSAPDGEIHDETDFPADEAEDFDTGFPETGFPEKSEDDTGFPETGFPETGFPEKSEGATGFPASGLPGGDDFDSDGLPGFNLNPSSETGASDDPLPALDMPEMDLDAMIEQQLQRDAEANNAFNPVAGAGLPQDLGVYSGDIEGDEFGEGLEWPADEAAAEGTEKPKKPKKPPKPKKKKEKKEKKSLRERLLALPLSKLLILAGSVAGFILLVGLAVILVVQVGVNRRIKQMEINRYTLITQPVDAANNANFIFVNEIQAVGIQAMTLRKISAGYRDTLFYFGESFDPDLYDMVLYDQNGKLYHRFRTDCPYLPGTATTLKFDALDSGTTQLTLRIQGAESSETASFRYRFDSPIIFTAPVFVNEPAVLSDNGSGLTLRLEKAVFGSTGSELLYSLSWKKNSGELHFMSETGAADIELKTSTEKLSAMSRQPTEYRFEKQETALGRLCFTPLRSLGTSVDVTFKNLFFEYQVPKLAIDLPRLFSRGGDSKQTFYMAGNALVLEGMGTQGRLAILVLHGEDAGGNRLETRIEANLTAETQSGRVAIPGKCVSGPQGTDVVFDRTDYRDQLEGLALDDYALEIKSVQFNVLSLTTRLDLTQSPNVADAQQATVIKDIQNAFLSRLAYASQTTGADQVTGFTAEVLEDRGLMRQYSPAVSDETPMYAAKVVNGLFKEEDTYLAVVEEEWAIGVNDELTCFHATHQVIAVNENGNWLIVSDTIVQ